MSVVCLDTQILFWGIRQVAARGAENLVPKAKDFLYWLEAHKIDVIVPAIVVGEMLVPIPAKEHNEVLAKFQDNWMIVDYDLKAASLFAQIRYEQNTQRLMKEIRRNPHATRRELVADAMIIATAIAHGADKIYTHDNNLISLARDYIVAENFENVPIQMSLDLPDEEEKPGQQDGE
jgi:predicted nucleic acid-binding protein